MNDSFFCSLHLYILEQQLEHRRASAIPGREHTGKEKVLFVSVVRLLVSADDEPDAGQPVSGQRERHHQEGQDHHAVLRVPEVLRKLQTKSYLFDGYVRNTAWEFLRTSLQVETTCIQSKVQVISKWTIPEILSKVAVFKVLLHFGFYSLFIYVHISFYFKLKQC